MSLGSLEAKKGKQGGVAAKGGGAEQVGTVVTQSSHSSSSSSSPAWSSPSSGGRQKEWNSGWVGGLKSLGEGGFQGLRGQDSGPWGAEVSYQEIRSGVYVLDEGELGFLFGTRQGLQLGSGFQLELKLILSKMCGSLVYYCHTKG